MFYQGICVLEMLLKHQETIQGVIVDSGSSLDQQQPNLIDDRDEDAVVRT